MAHSLIIRPEASEDAEEAAQWYEGRAHGLGWRFLSELDAAIQSIAEAPLRFSVYHDAIRKTRLKRFPYGVFYATTDTSVVVLAVIHLHRDPLLIRRIIRGR